MKKIFVIIIVFSIFAFGKNYIKEGGESLTPNEFIKIKIDNSKFSENLNIFYWDFSKGEWIEESESRIRIQDSTISWKPNKKVLELPYSRIKVLNERNEQVFISPSYFSLAEDTSEKPIFQTETEEETNSFKIFPNPVKDKTINIVSEKPKAQIQSLKVIDMSGLTIFEVSNIEISGNYNLHLPNISRGAYIIQISTPEKIETKKLIIE